jgi:DMSO/TMAO reductase YedYZ heme-binding membrane subunit
MSSIFTSILRALFFLHDGAAEFVRKYYGQVKIVLLLIAHASLFGFFFPDARNDFGEWARNILLGLLFLSPLARLFPISLLQLLMGLRRQLGILFAYLVSVHGLGYFLDPNFFQFAIAPFLSSPLQIDPRLLCGMVAYVLTLPLLLTSNDLSLKLLKGNWKKLHRIVYVVFVLGMLHAFTIREASGWWEAALVIGAYLVLKICAHSPNVGALLSLKKYVAEEYARYRVPREEYIAEKPEREVEQ